MYVYVLNYNSKEIYFKNFDKLCKYVITHDVYGEVLVYDAGEYFDYINSDDYFTEIPEIIDSFRIWKHPVTNKIMEG